MSKELCQALTDEISIIYCKKPQELPTQMPMFLNLQKDRVGLIAVPYWETDGVSLGDYTVRSFGEHPNVDVESHLSQILEEHPHPKYYLSAKACAGIIKRAESRGKELPPILKEALEQQVTRSKFGGGSETDSKGNRAGKGALVQVERSGTLGVTQDQTLICIEGNGTRQSHSGDGWRESDTMYTINATEQHAIAYRKQGHPTNAEDGQGWEEAKVADTLNSFDISEKRTPTIVVNCVRGDGKYGGDTAFAITGDHDRRPSDLTNCVCYSQDAYDKYSESDKSASLKACGGNFGGGRNP